jgi:ABC-type multidrug transport system fused ATPase/permease subunit
MIAHRLNTLKNCDLILVLEQGQLLEIRETLSEAFAATAGLD